MARTLIVDGSKGTTQCAVSLYARSTLNNLGGETKEKPTLKANPGHAPPAQRGPELSNV